MPSKTNLESLLPFAKTESQKAAIEAYIKHGTQRKSAASLKIHRTTFQDRIRAVENNAAKQGWSPEHDMTKPTPEGYHLKGTSTLYDEDGSIKVQWVKTDKDKEFELEIAQALYREMSQTVKRLPAIQEPNQCDSDLLNFYPITDAHVGMLAWHREGGRDWDISIAEEVITDAFRRAVSRSDKAERCVIGQLGDFLHFDGFDPVTPASRHILDADSRFPKLVSASIRIHRALIDEALRKHKQVHLIVCEGNHDPASSVWIRELLMALYEKEDRLTIDDSPLPYYAYQHGKTMLGFHHGHLKRQEALPAYFAAQEAKMWGATEFRYAHCGHLHSEKSEESGGMHVTRHSTIAAQDAYASRHGYTSQSKMVATTYHKEFGKWSSVDIIPKR